MGVEPLRAPEAVGEHRGHRHEVEDEQVEKRRPGDREEREASLPGRRAERALVDRGQLGGERRSRRRADLLRRRLGREPEAPASSTSRRWRCCCGNSTTIASPGREDEPRSVLATLAEMRRPPAPRARRGRGPAVAGGGHAALGRFPSSARADRRRTFSGRMATATVRPSNPKPLGSGSRRDPRYRQRASRPRDRPFPRRWSTFPRRRRRSGSAGARRGHPGGRAARSCRCSSRPRGRSSRAPRPGRA